MALGIEGGAKGLVGFVGLLVDELETDLVFGSEVADGLCSRKGSDGKVLPLAGIEGLGGAGGGRRGGFRDDGGYNAHAWNSWRSWPVNNHGLRSFRLFRYPSRPSAALLLLPTLEPARKKDWALEKKSEDSS